MKYPAPPILCALVTLLVTGCTADTTNYPSLAKRPAERIYGSADVVPADPAQPQPPAPPSPELVARLAQLTAEAEAAHRAFLAQRDETARRVAAAQGTAVASENWSVAAIALAELEAARSRAMISLAELDALYAAERIAGGEAGAIAAARDQVIALVRQEDAVLADLRGRLPA
jgi:hypothetical protein